MRNESGKRLSELRNIGPKSAEWLREVGIVTLDDLEELGAVEAYQRVKHRFPERVSLNMLYGLQAALLNIHWTELPPDMKADLKAQAEE
ncbi:MAG: TfoX/Sxy family protein [Chloroflexi bacterium]|nr:TfoX/Sxy family protein [Chloroflexota bacterium]